MANAGLATVLRHLQRVAAIGQANAQGDGELLRRFIDRHDEAAFAVLVRRHAGMVFGVCRHALAHEQDAEDAFQATFLALAQGAASIRKADSLASWLHGVAYRMSLKAKRDAARRRAHESRPAPREVKEPPAELTWREVQAALDEEINRLPEKYRSPFVLCCLEGKSRKETARELGLSEGTVWSRLSEARKKLHTRLARRGVALPALLAALAVEGEASACVSPLLVSSTSRAAFQFATGGSVAGTVSANALSLATGVTKTMLFTKLKIATALLLAVGSLITGAGIVAHSSSAAKEPEAQKQEVKAPAAVGARKPKVVDAGAAVDAVSWSADGKLLATQVRTWAPTPDGGKVLTGRALQIRDADGAVRRTLYDEDNVWDVRFSPDGKSVAAALAGENVVKLWDPATGKEQRTFKGANIAGASLTNIAFSRDGRLLAAAGGVSSVGRKSNGAVFLWETGSGKLLWQVRAHTTDVWERAVEFSPDGKRLATGAGETIKLWDTATGKCEQTLRCHEGHGVFSLAFSPDGKLLASGGLDGTVRLWDPDSGKLKQFVTSGYCWGLKLVVAFSPDGRWLAAGGTALGGGRDGQAGDVRFFDRTGKFDRAFHNVLRDGVTSLAFSPDGETLAVGNWDKQLLLLPLQK